MSGVIYGEGAWSLPPKGYMYPVVLNGRLIGWAQRRYQAQPHHPSCAIAVVDGAGRLLAWVSSQEEARWHLETFSLKMGDLGTLAAPTRATESSWRGA